MSKPRLWAVALVAVASALGPPGPSFDGPGRLGPAVAAAQVVEPGTETQTSVGGAVTVKVTWQGPEAGPVFAVVMDTHSVTLDAYDLGQLALLRTDQGVEVQPTGWEAPSGGHHREGTLSFPSVAPDGGPVFGPSTRLVELVIRDVAVPERVLQWSL